MLSYTIVLCRALTLLIRPWCYAASCTCIIHYTSLRDLHFVCRIWNSCEIMTKEICDAVICQMRDGGSVSENVIDQIDRRWRSQENDLSKCVFFWEKMVSLTKRMVAAEIFRKCFSDSACKTSERLWKRGLIELIGLGQDSINILGQALFEVGAKLHDLHGEVGDANNEELNLLFKWTGNQIKLFQWFENDYCRKIVAKGLQLPAKANQEKAKQCLHTLAIGLLHESLSCCRISFEDCLRILTRNSKNPYVCTQNLWKIKTIRNRIVHNRTRHQFDNVRERRQFTKIYVEFAYHCIWTRDCLMLESKSKSKSEQDKEWRYLKPLLSFNSTSDGGILAIRDGKYPETVKDGRQETERPVPSLVQEAQEQWKKVKDVVSKNALNLDNKDQKPFENLSHTLSALTLRCDDSEEISSSSTQQENIDYCEEAIFIGEPSTIRNMRQLFDKVKEYGTITCLKYGHRGSIVCFDTKDEAAKAMKKLKEGKLRVNKAHKERVSKLEDSKIYVELEKMTTKQDFETMCQNYGFKYVTKWPDQAYGFVEFRTRANAIKALKDLQDKNVLAIMAFAKI